MVIFPTIMLLVILATFLVLFFMVGINYRVTRSHLTITFWGIPIRWAKLSTIVSVSKRRRFTAEQWVSTFRMKHRKLVVRRDKGILREWVITPKYRYVFRQQLEDAIAQARGSDMSVK